jgi:hypothetical protein
LLSLPPLQISEMNLQNNVQPSVYIDGRGVLKLGETVLLHKRMEASVDGILTSCARERAAQVLLCLCSDQCMPLISMIFTLVEKRASIHPL